MRVALYICDTLHLWQWDIRVRTKKPEGLSGLEMREAARVLCAGTQQVPPCFPNDECRPQSRGRGFCKSGRPVHRLPHSMHAAGFADSRWFTTGIPSQESALPVRLITE